MKKIFKIPELPPKQHKELMKKFEKHILEDQNKMQRLILVGLPWHKRLYYRIKWWLE